LSLHRLDHGYQRAVVGGLLRDPCSYDEMVLADSKIGGVAKHPAIPGTQKTAVWVGGGTRERLGRVAGTDGGSSQAALRSPAGRGAAESGFFSINNLKIMKSATSMLMYRTLIWRGL
jgi:hypothetical protein